MPYPETGDSGGQRAGPNLMFNVTTPNPTVNVNVAEPTTAQTFGPTSVLHTITLGQNLFFLLNATLNGEIITSPENSLDRYFIEIVVSLIRSGQTNVELFKKSEYVRNHPQLGISSQLIQGIVVSGNSENGDQLRIEARSNVQLVTVGRTMNFVATDQYYNLLQIPSA